MALVIVPASWARESVGSEERPFAVVGRSVGVEVGVEDAGVGVGGVWADVIVVDEEEEEEDVVDVVDEEMVDEVALDIVVDEDVDVSIVIVVVDDGVERCEIIDDEDDEDDDDVVEDGKSMFSAEETSSLSWEAKEGSDRYGSDVVTAVPDLEKGDLVEGP